MDTSTYYDTYWSADGFCPSGETVPPLRELFEAHIEPGFDCLDVGCGDGGTSGLWLDSHARSYRGVDVSAPAIALAQEAGLNAQVIDDAATLPFADSSFDAAVCVEVLEHVFEPQRAVAEIARVLRPGGLLIISVPNVAYWRRRADLALLGRWNPLGDELSTTQPWRDPHIRFFTRRALAGMLKSHGYADARVGGYGGTILGDIPLLRRLCRRHGGWAVADWRPNPLYRLFERAWPGLFGYRLYAVARRP